MTLWKKKHSTTAIHPIPAYHPYRPSKSGTFFYVLVVGWA